jgi:TatA/E family protein of Tat protein translocase
MIGSLLQPAHIIVILAILVLLFGGRWFANLGKGFAAAVRNFKRSMSSSNRS